MAQWRKVIVSGSSAVLNEISASGAIVPKADNGSDLGSSALEWKDLYIDGTANIDNLVLNSGATVTGIDNGSLGSSATLLATQGAVKTYVDALVTVQDLDATTDSGTIDIDLDSETLTIAGGEGIDTSASGTTITIAGEDATTGNKGIASFSSANFGVSSGVVSIKDAGVILGTETTGDYVSTAVAGSGIDVSGATGAVTISIGTGEVVNAMIGDNEVNSEHYAAASIDDEHLADEVATGLAGTGMTAASGVMNVIGTGGAVSVSANAVTLVAANTTLTSIINGSFSKIGTSTSEEYIDFSTNNEVNTKVNDTERLSVTSAGVDVTGALTTSGNLTVGGDLDVNGTVTTIDTANTYVADKFMIIASGSTSATDGGFIVQNDTNTGYALGYDTGTSRWSLQNDLSHTATNLVPDAYVGTVELGTTDGDSQSAPTYGSGVGSIYVDTNDSEIWIYA
jgi:hypothetical protein